jgi:hypothetical protein
MPLQTSNGGIAELASSQRLRPNNGVRGARTTTTGRRDEDTERRPVAWAPSRAYYSWRAAASPRALPSPRGRVAQAEGHCGAGAAWWCPCLLAQPGGPAHARRLACPRVTRGDEGVERAPVASRIRWRSAAPHAHSPRPTLARLCEWRSCALRARAGGWRRSMRGALVKSSFASFAVIWQNVSHLRPRRGGAALPRCRGGVAARCSQRCSRR